MKIGLVGYFGYGNYGDELFLRIWRDTFGFGNTQIILPGDDISDIDKIIIGGGDLVPPNFLNNNYFRDELFQKDVYIYGVGVPLQIKNEIPTVKEQYKKLFSKAKYISVRDSASLEWFNKNEMYEGTKQVEDLAWVFDSNVKMPRNNHIVGITYRPCGITTDEMMEKCWYLKDMGWKHFLLIPLQDGYVNTRDLSVLLKERLLTMSPYVNIIPYSDIDHKYRYINSVGLYITTAFHGMVTALAGDTPVIPLLGDNKFVQLGKDVGIKCATNLPEFMTEYRKTKEQDRDKLNKKVFLIRDKARKELREFRDLICK